MSTDPEMLALIRDYEGQIALLKLRIEHLEQSEANLNRSLTACFSRPEEMLKRLQIAGFPAIDIKTIFKTLDEWHKNGGNDSLVKYIQGWEVQ